MADSAHVKFRRLIEGRQIPGQNTDFSSLEQLKRKVLNFIDQNQDLEHMISENVSDSTQKSINIVHTMDNLCSMTVDSCVSLLKSQASQGSCSLDLLAAEVLAKNLIQLSRRDASGSANEYPTGQLLVENQKASVVCITKTVKSLLSEQSFNRVHFAKCLSSKGHQLQLEVLYILHKECIISFNTYLAYSFQYEKGEQRLVESFIDLCFYMDDESKQQRQLILSVLLGPVLSLAYPDHKASKTGDTGLAQTSQDVLNKIIKGCEDRSARDTGESGTKSIQVLEVIRTMATVPHLLVCKFFTNQLNRTLCPSTVPSTSGFEPVVTAFCNQKNWTFASLSEETRDKFSQFLLVFEPATIMDTLKHALHGQQVEWRVVLSFLSVFLVCVKDAAHLIEAHVSRVVADSLSACDSRLLTVAFLIIRQASREGGHVFQPYVTWFQKTFGDSSSSGLNSKRNVQFFMKFLTDLVPYEPAEYMKVHIIKSPALPSKLRPFLTDYVSLAKTRLMDLKEPLELMPLTGEGSAVDGTMKSGLDKQLEQAAKDVEKSLEAYEKSGKVPSSVMEASIFRKPYFIGRFLPALLIPRKVPEVPDARSQFIETLTKAGKIPNSLIRAYKTACEKMEEESCEVSSDDEQSQLGILGKLQKRLARMTVMVLDSVEGKPGVTSLLSLIGGDIKAFLCAKDQTASDVRHMKVDLYYPNLDKNVIKVSDVILNAFCRTCAAVRCRRAGAGPGQEDSHCWADGFVAMLASIPGIHAGVYFRLWNLICTQGLTLKEHHICGLTAFLCHLGACQVGSWCSTEIRQLNEQLAWTQSDSENRSKENFTFLDFLCDQIPLETREWMEFSIRFYCSFAQHALLNFTDISVDSHQTFNERTCYVPPVLIRKLCYLLDRLNVTENSMGENTLLPKATLRLSQLINSSPIFKKLKETTRQVTLAEWCSWELYVSSKQDFLSEIERHRYHQFTVLNHFLPPPSPNGGCDGSPRTACSVILDSILDFDNRVHHSAQLPSRSYEGSRQALINLLQKLLPLLPETDWGEKKSRDQWLIARFHSRMKKTSEARSTDCASISYDGQQTSETVSFIRVAVALPPYLLFCDKSSSTPDAAAIQSVVSFINTMLRPSLGELCHFPFDVTLYLLKAVLTCGPTDSFQRSTRPVHLSSLLEHCPIFFISLQYYWKQLKPLAVRLCGRSTLHEQFLNVDSVFNCLSRLHCTDDHIRYQGIRLQELEHVPPAVVAACVFLRATSQNEMKAFLEAKDSCAQSFFSEVVVCLFDCFVAKYAAITQEGCELDVENEEFNENFVVLLAALPKVLLVFSEDEEHEFKGCLERLRSQVLVENLRKMYPVVYFSLLTRVPQHVLQQLIKFDGFVRITLRMHQEFESLRGRGVRGKTLVEQVIVKPFHLDFCHQVFTFVRDRLLSCPVETLRNLHQSLVLACQAELRQVLLHRLRR